VEYAADKLTGWRWARRLPKSVLVNGGAPGRATGPKRATFLSSSVRWRYPTADNNNNKVAVRADRSRSWIRVCQAEARTAWYLQALSAAAATRPIPAAASSLVRMSAETLKERPDGCAFLKRWVLSYEMLPCMQGCLGDAGDSPPVARSCVVMRAEAMATAAACTVANRSAKARH
jgi:hypothetical protein